MGKKLIGETPAEKKVRLARNSKKHRDKIKSGKHIRKRDRAVKDPDAKSTPKTTWAMLQQGFDRKNLKLVQRNKMVMAYATKQMHQIRKLNVQVAEQKEKVSRLQKAQVEMFKAASEMDKTNLMNQRVGHQWKKLAETLMKDCSSVPEELVPKDVFSLC